MERKNAIIGQSGGPTAAINATLAGVIHTALSQDGIDKLYGMRYGIEGIFKRNIVILNDAYSNPETLELLKQTPAAALGSCRMKLPEADADPKLYQELFSFFDKYGIGYFFYIGGNDSMDTVKKLSEYAAKGNIDGVRFIGIPKTIDNDLVGTDHTPGYGSAAKYIATSVAEIACDCAAYTVKAVTIVEIMGRDAGWLTASAALAQTICGHGADYIYLPESEFSDEKLFFDIKRAFEQHPNVVIAVSEGLRYANGEYVGTSGQCGAVDVFGHRYLSGAGKILEQKIKAHFGCKVRSVEVNILQRCAAHLLSATDIEESFSTGKQAVNYALSGQTGVMVCIRREEGDVYRISYYCDKIEGIANQTKSVPACYINTQGNQISNAGIAYMLPLIQGEIPIFFENGLPKHINFDQNNKIEIQL